MSNTEDTTAVEEEEEKDTEEQEEQGVEEQVPEEQEESVKAKPSNELKVVIILNDDNVMLGVQSPDCDPVYKTFKGDLAVALKHVPKLVKEAKKKWNDSPRYPKANLPTPEPAPAPARIPAPKKEKPAQPSFF